MAKKSITRCKKSVRKPRKKSVRKPHKKSVQKKLCGRMMKGLSLNVDDDTPSSFTSPKFSRPALSLDDSFFTPSPRPFSKLSLDDVKKPKFSGLSLSVNDEDSYPKMSLFSSYSETDSFMEKDVEEFKHMSEVPEEVWDEVYDHLNIYDENKRAVFRSNIENFEKLSQLPLDRIEDMLKKDSKGYLDKIINISYHIHDNLVQQSLRTIQKGSLQECNIYKNANQECRILGQGIDGVAYQCGDKIVKKYSKRIAKKEYIYRMISIIQRLNDFLEQNHHYKNHFTLPQLINCSNNSFNPEEIYEIQDHAGRSIQDYLETYSNDIPTLRQRVIELMKEYGAIIIFLAQNNLYHNDSHKGNLFMKNEKPVFIDYGRMTYDYPLDAASFLSENKEDYIYDLALLLSWLDIIYKETVIQLTYSQSGIPQIDTSISTWLNNYFRSFYTDPYYQGNKFVKSTGATRSSVDRFNFTNLPEDLGDIDRTIGNIRYKTSQK